MPASYLNLKEKTMITYKSLFNIFLAVKLVVDRNSGQALGFAYIWFTSADAAKLAVKEMNGKVCPLVIVIIVWCP